MKKIVITMLVLLSAAYAVGIGGGEVARKLNLRPSQIVPAADTLPVRNLIYLIGDGMGLSHVSMLMLEEGYGTTAFDRAQNIALITTYSANNRVTDSAAVESGSTPSIPLPVLCLVASAVPAAAESVTRLLAE